MNAPAHSFLRAKHWQLFLPAFAYGVLADVLVVRLAMTTADSPAAFQVLALVNAALTVPFLICLLLWYWSVGSFLHSVAQPSLRPSLRFFRVALIYPPVYVLTFFTVVLNVESPFLAVILPFHLFAMYCLLYDLYFLSKSLRLVENGKRVSFSDYAGAFFLFCFFPVGIWFLQPRINRLYAKMRTYSSLDVATAQ
jgi:hypothetical protein